MAKVIVNNEVEEGQYCRVHGEKYIGVLTNLIIPTSKNDSSVMTYCSACLDGIKKGIDVAKANEGTEFEYSISIK